MRITLLSIGSRGDTQPYLALGVGLRRAGHEVTLAAPQIYREWIEGCGVAYAPISANPQEIIRQPEIAAKLKSGNVVRFLLAVQRETAPMWQRAFDDFWQACQGADAVLGSITAPGYVDIADRLSVPAITAQLAPLSPTRAFPSFPLPIQRSLGGPLNWLTGWLFDTLFWLGMSGIVNQFRRRLGMPPRRRSPNVTLNQRGALVLCAFSSAVIPRPADWPPNHHVTGYWFLDAPADFQPPADLHAFLEAGPRPVYVGFGSMSVDDPQRTTRLALDALQQAGVRGVLSAGWAGLGEGEIPNSIHQIGSIPHDWLFPRMAAVVIHGGAGTTSAVLRAGVPAIVTPFQADQFGWGRAVERLGVGPKPIPIRRLTAESLSGAIRDAMGSPAMQARAAALGERIRAEDGVGEAVRLIEMLR